MNNISNSINVLSLFDGCSGAHQALCDAGIKVKQYYASEVDKYAVKITQKNFPNTIQLGDVKDVVWKDKHLHSHLQPPIDLLIGGSPCQDLSFAGHQKGLVDGTRSNLFYEYVRILKELREINPNLKFLLENVRMKKESQNVISNLLGVEPIPINSAKLSAQNRQRLYWTNIDEVRQPNDKGIVLKDILEDGFSDRDKSHCIDANYFKGGNLKSYFEKHRRQLVFSKDGLCHVGDADIKGIDSLKRVYHANGKAPTLTTMQGGHREPKVLVVKGGRIVNRRKNKYGVRKDNDKSIPLLPFLEVRKDKKTNCITTVYKDSVVVYDEQLKWRKLTPLECERLQGFPDNYTEGVSNTQRYKMLGNAFNVMTITHILNQLKKGKDNA